MGGGSWTTETYATRTSAKAAAGYASSFAYHEDIASGKVAAEVHESLDPKRVAGDLSPNAGRPIRESFDSEEHPNSVPIAVVFDETGSMGSAPRILQEKLPLLFGLLQRKGYVEDPQLLFAAVGDATGLHERAPYQIGQFESDNRGDEQLENFYLEGMGGGGNHESYAGIAHYLAYHTDLDSVKKRDKKGYLFFIGDERLYETFPESEARHYMGDQVADDLKKRFEGDADTEQIFRDLQERFEVYLLFPTKETFYSPETCFDGAGGGDSSAFGWNTVLPKERLIVLESAETVSETIALIIGIAEGTVDLDEGLEDLGDVGADRTAIEATGKALATVGAGSGGAPLATVEGGPELSGDSGAETL
jgi:hypothetical protein